MKHDQRHVGIVEHTIDLTDKEVEEAVWEYLSKRLQGGFPTTAEIVFDAGCCALHSAQITWKETKE
jgi:hypothetical protein